MYHRSYGFHAEREKKIAPKILKLNFSILLDEETEEWEVGFCLISFFSFIFAFPPLFPLFSGSISSIPFVRDFAAMLLNGSRQHLPTSNTRYMHIT